MKNRFGRITGFLILGLLSLSLSSSALASGGPVVTRDPNLLTNGLRTAFTAIGSPLLRHSSQVN
jgi:hypothetical protein